MNEEQEEVTDFHFQEPLVPPLRVGRVCWNLSQMSEGEGRVTPGQVAGSMQGETETNSHSLQITHVKAICSTDVELKHSSHKWQTWAKSQTNTGKTLFRKVNFFHTPQKICFNIIC